VGARIFYTDVDGTLVGPRGNFFRAPDGSLTLEPAEALLALHSAAVDVVLVSGRTRPQLMEAALLLGASGFIAELGGLVGWTERGRLRVQHLPAAGPPATPELVAARGAAHLRLCDNGLTANGDHVFHLIPAGVGKAEAVGWDLARRGLVPADAVAVGDSKADLEMASTVGSFWLVANALAHPGITRESLPPNACVTTAAMGLGWAEAARAVAASAGQRSAAR